MARRTLAKVAGLNKFGELTARETVWLDTPASLATSFTVAAIILTSYATYATLLESRIDELF